ncbi:DNA-directed RNA polymerase V subunit 1-like [Larimichthys crocea]|uniref:DNA-directed RNA polymerase V subunit 1-like n=1 Tax=Larimichthys crocea TaxID=215358 RepID=UPI000F5D5813|nr:DNA-directed RNA polymerase V subunit 1-like [Larimichthys crocea]
MQVYPKEDNNEFEDRTAFIDLLKQLLHPIGDQRISPHQALHHSFFTMSHLTELPDSSDYLTTSRALMSCCPMEESDPAAWSEGELPNISDDEDPAAWPEGELPNISDEEDPAAWSEGELPNVSDDEDPAAWPEGELPNISDDEDPAAWSEEELPNVSCDREPSDWSAEGLAIVTCVREPSDWTSHEGQSLSNDEDLNLWSSDGKNLLDSFRKFFG